jgi:hypothetical protein
VWPTMAMQRAAQMMRATTKTARTHRPHGGPVELGSRRGIWSFRLALGHRRTRSTCRAGTLRSATGQEPRHAAGRCRTLPCARGHPGGRPRASP